MLIYRSLGWTIIIALFAFTLTGTPVQAQVTLTGPSTITLTEDGSNPTFSYTLTNNSSTLIDGLAFGPGTSFGSPSGDGSDVFTGGSFISGGDCTASLAVGSSCNLMLGIVLDNGAGETDGDSGTRSVNIDVRFNFIDPATGAQLTQDVLLSTLVTVNDPGVSATPEPPSFLLLSSGVLGLLGALRRKLLF